MNCPMCNKEIEEEDNIVKSYDVDYHIYCYCKNMKNALEEIVAECKSIEYASPHLGNIKNTA